MLSAVSASATTLQCSLDCYGASCGGPRSLASGTGHGVDLHLLLEGVLVLRSVLMVLHKARQSAGGNGCMDHAVMDGCVMRQRVEY